MHKPSSAARWALFGTRPRHGAARAGRPVLTDPPRAARSYDIGVLSGGDKTIAAATDDLFQKIEKLDFALRSKDQDAAKPLFEDADVRCTCASRAQQPACWTG
eukprot:scaffold2430_cov336-Prasinococcus_capsulatus_cf.AAC.2